MISILGTVVTAYLSAFFANESLARWQTLTRRPLLRRTLQIWSHFPPSLLAGAALLLLGPQLLGASLPLIPSGHYEAYRLWPSVLISFLFAGLIIEPSQRKTNAHVGAVLSQGLYVWLVSFLQLALGYAVVWVLGKEAEQRLFAHTIELSFLGGHASASAFYDVATRLGLRSAADLSLAAATVGILWGLSGGLVLTAFHRRYPNYGVGFFSRKEPLDIDREREGEQSVGQQSALASKNADEKTSDQREEEVITEDEVVDEKRFLLSFLIPVLPVFLAYLLMQGLAAVLPDSLAPTVNEVPLFFSVIVLAFLLKKALRPFLSGAAVRTFHRLVLEALVTAAVATVSLQTIAEYADILFWLCSGAMLLTLLLHLFAAPYLTPHYPDLALINFGMSTGTTAVGLTLLRSLRPSLPLRPVQVYGLAAPLSSPFIGGGLLSLFLFPKLTTQFPAPIMLLFMTALALGIVAVLLLLRRLQAG